MDSFNNAWHKLNKLDRQSKENETELSKLIPDFTKSDVREYVNKTPQTLYDSGWVTQNTTSGLYTPIMGVLAHLGTSLNFTGDINISKEQLGFVKTSIMVKPTPEVNVKGLYIPSIGYIGIKHDATLDCYHEIEGDGSPIYAGHNAIVKFSIN